MKTVQVLGYRFDCLPGHVTIAGKGEGHNLRVAAARAVENMLDDNRLRHKQVGDFKLSVVVTGNTHAVSDAGLSAAIGDV